MDEHILLGSPHLHSLFWCKDACKEAPVIDKNTDEEVIRFIDKHVTCDHLAAGQFFSFLLSCFAS